MALEVVDVLVEDDQVTPVPLDGVVVRVFDAAGTVFITSGTSGDTTTGHVEFTLNGDDPPIQYSLRFFKSGVSILSPQVIEVFTPPANSPTGTNNFKVVATVAVLPVATDPRLCRVSGFIKDGAGRPRPGIDMHFVPQFNPLIVDDIGVLGERVTHRTDVDGFLSIDLWRNGGYLVMIESHENVTRPIVVPDRSSVSLLDLLFPIVVSVTYLPAPPWSLAVGATLDIVPTVTASDFQVLDGTANEDVLYTSDDATIASSTTQTNRITLRGIAPGTTNLVVIRQDLSIINVPDPGISGASSVITVT